MENSNKNITTENIKTLNEKDAGIFYSALLISVLAIAFTVGACITMFVGETDVSKQNWYILINLFVSGIALIVASLVGTRLSNSTVKNNVGKLKVDYTAYIVCGLLLFSMFFVLGDLNNLVISLFERFGYKQTETVMPSLSPINLILVIISVCLLPAVFEEYIFRGCILNGLKVFGERKAILISALFFAFYHMSPSKTAYQLVVGLIFGFVAVKYKSILPTIIIHFLNNLYIILNYYFWGFAPENGLKWGLFVVGIIFLGVAIYLLSLKFKFENDKKQGNYHELIVYGSAGIICALAVWISGFFL